MISRSLIISLFLMSLVLISTPIVTKYFQPVLEFISEEYGNAKEVRVRLGTLRRLKDEMTARDAIIELQQERIDKMNDYIQKMLNAGEGVCI